MFPMILKKLGYLSLHQILIHAIKLAGPGFDYMHGNNSPGDPYICHNLHCLISSFSAILANNVHQYKQHI